MLRGKTSAPVLLLDGTGRSRSSSSSVPQESTGRKGKGVWLKGQTVIVILVTKQGMVSHPKKKAKVRRTNIKNRKV